MSNRSENYCLQCGGWLYKDRLHRKFCNAVCREANDAEMADRGHEFLAYKHVGFTTDEIAEMFGTDRRIVSKYLWEAQNDEDLRRIYQIEGIRGRDMRIRFRDRHRDQSNVIPISKGAGGVGS